MEAEVVDSLWEIARQAQGIHQDKIVIARSIWRRGQAGFYELYFNTIEEVINYFKVEEVGDGSYDPADRVIVFYYDLPTGSIIRIYAFFETQPFLAVVNSLRHQLQKEDLELDISRRVISNGDPGINPPQSRKEQELILTPLQEDYSELQDYTDADLEEINRYVSTDLNKEPFGTPTPTITTNNNDDNAFDQDNLRGPTFYYM